MSLTLYPDGLHIHGFSGMSEDIDMWLDQITSVRKSMSRFTIRDNQGNEIEFDIGGFGVYTARRFKDRLDELRKSQRQN